MYHHNYRNIFLAHILAIAASLHPDYGGYPILEEGFLVVRARSPA